jgi:hypothetical protein
MKVRLLIGAAYAYACIKHKNWTMDVRLEPGRSAHQSLRESATECRIRANRELARAELMEQAAKILEKE